MFETENERQKTKPVPILLPRASRNFPDVKTRNEKKFHNWTSEIIPFIRLDKQMERTINMNMLNVELIRATLSPIIGFFLPQMAFFKLEKPTTTFFSYTSVDKIR